MSKASGPRRRLRLVGGPLLLVFAAGMLVWFAGSQAIGRAPVATFELPSHPTVERVVLKADGAPDLVGWVAEGSERCGIVILLHGRGATKRSMIDRARLFNKNGLAVALFDLSGHGESGGDMVGFGFSEAADVERIRAWTAGRFPNRSIGAVGTSLGAAALVFSARRAMMDAYVLEQLYATLRETTAKRMNLPGWLAELQADLLLAQMPLRLGYGAGDVRPVDRIGELTAPVIILAGTDDTYVSRDQSERLHAAAPGGNTLTWVEARGHVDLQRANPETYAAAVLPFLDRTLCSPGPGSR